MAVAAPTAPVATPAITKFATINLAGIIKLYSKQFLYFWR
jgi:hypothetical protein